MTRTYVLTRKELTLKSTIGELTLDGQHICWILEDRVRKAGEPKVAGQTAIGFGKYRLVITKSERFSKAAGKDVFMALLLDVPLFSGIRIHSGSTAADSSGCLIAGTIKAKNRVSDSRKALKKFQDQLQGFLDAGEECWISVVK